MVKLYLSFFKSTHGYKWKNQIFQTNILFVYILQVNNEILRENLERIVGTDDSAFSGIDLATLIRNKYGRSYDVQLIKKVCFLYLKRAMILANLELHYKHSNIILSFLFVYLLFFLKLGFIYFLFFIIKFLL
jgi:hypothetical protein